MPSWGNTDRLEDKPHWPVERTMRPGMDTANGGGTSLTYTASSATYASNGTSIVAANANTLFLSSTAGINAGMSVTEITTGSSNLAYNSGEAGYFLGNVTVQTVNSSNVVLKPAPGQTYALQGNIAVGSAFVFGNTINYPTGTYETTYWKDTILVTATRQANNTVAIMHGNSGWNHVRKKINNDGTTRYISETLVALNAPVASNTSSANTSNTQVYTGV
jgi:hypothetical protein